MNESFRKVANSAVAAVVAGALCIGVPQQAMAQDPAPVDTTPTNICYRGRTVSVPAYLVSRYVAGGATVGACVTSP